MAKPQKGSTPAAIKYYLVAFNAVSFLGWAYVLVLTLVHLFNLDGQSPNVTSSYSRSASSILNRVFSKVVVRKASSVPEWLQPVYERATTTFYRVGVQTAFVQSLAVMEILHVVVGWVRSPVGTTASQVFSRLFLVWGIAERFPNTQSNPIYTSMVLAWSITEVIRYSFYAFNLLGYNPYVLLWLRYTTFFILYPVGASSEAFLMYATLPSSAPGMSAKSWLQGLWGPGDYLRAAFFVIWWPGLYVMYTYMIGQRRKVLGGKPSKTKRA